MKRDSPLNQSGLWANDYFQFNGDNDAELEHYWANLPTDVNPVWDQDEYDHYNEILDWETQVYDLEERVTQHEKYEEMITSHCSNGFTPSLADQMQNLGSSHSWIGSRLSFQMKPASEIQAIWKSHQMTPQLPLN